MFNAGGGNEISVSLSEWTAQAREATGNEVDIGSVPEQAAVDIPYYVSDNAKAAAAFGWRPKFGSQEIAREIAAWLGANEAMALRNIFG